MKNRRSTSELVISDSATKRSFTDLKIKRKPLSSSLLEKSASFLHTYNTLFKKTVYHYGDADSYFKKTLRNYDGFEFNPPIRRPKTARTEAKKKPQLGQGDWSKTKLHTVSETSIVVRHEKAREEEDAFYSPNSQFDNESLYTMADEEVEGGEEPAPEPDTEGGAADGENDLDALEEELGLPKDDAKILKEVAECEAQCMEIYKILSELKGRVSELLSKVQRTPEEDQELGSKQKLLNEKMSLLEQKTRRIEILIGQTKKPDYDKPYDEDTLPKVVVCGLADNNMPKFIICDDKKRRAGKRPPCNPITGQSPTCGKMRPSMPCAPSPPCAPCDPCPPAPCAPPPCPGPICPPPCIKLPPPCINVMPQFAQRLSESYDMQERLANENADLEGKRFQLQGDLLSKDHTVDHLQKQLCSLQSELRMVVKENGLLNSKLKQTCPPPPSPPCTPCTPCSPCSPRSPCTKPPCMPCLPVGPLQTCGDPPPCGRMRPCPAKEEEMETRKLEKQLNDMESEVKAIQNELCTVRQERIHLEQHRRMLSPPCPPPCVPVCPRQDNTQLRELREKYNCLQDDYKSKLIEVAGLRADVDKLKVSTTEAIEAKRVAEEKAKEQEKALKDARANDAKSQLTKEQLTELEQQMSVSKQRFREAQDELEELRALTEEQQGQLSEYRNKYLEAQQQVEEQKRQMDMMEIENNRIGEQVNLEIQRVKNQFQEKLQELTPLPDILKATQIKLQEAQQMHLMAERNNEALLREIQTLRDKAALIADEMEKSRSSMEMDEAHKNSLEEKAAEMEARLEELTEQNENMLNKMSEMQDQVADAEKRAQEKLHEIAQLNAEVENVREESARQVSRTKDRCETIRRSMQNQVCDLEKQLAQSRAQAKSAQRDRDEIRQKMQSQINNLNENFEDAQMRIRSLQGHVNFLKTSAAVYPSIENLPNPNCPI